MGLSWWKAAMCDSQISNQETHTKHQQQTLVDQFQMFQDRPKLERSPSLAAKTVVIFFFQFQLLCTKRVSLPVWWDAEMQKLRICCDKLQPNLDSKARRNRVRPSKRNSHQDHAFKEANLSKKDVESVISNLSLNALSQTYGCFQK